jgi:hypothetical protein
VSLRVAADDRLGPPLDRWPDGAIVSIVNRSEKEGKTGFRDRVSAAQVTETSGRVVVGPARDRQPLVRHDVRTRPLEPESQVKPRLEGAAVVVLFILAGDKNKRQCGGAGGIPTVRGDGAQAFRCRLVLPLAPALVLPFASALQGGKRDRPRPSQDGNQGQHGRVGALQATTQGKPRLCCDDGKEGFAQNE